VIQRLRLTTPSRLLASREPPIARADKLIARLGHGVSMIILIVDRRQLEELARIDCPRRRRAILRILALRRSVLVVEGPAHKCRPSSSPAFAEGDFVDGAA